MKLIANRDTYIKTQLLQSSSLAPECLIAITKGTTIELSDVIEDRGHYRFQAYIYEGHIKIVSETTAQYDIEIMAKTMWGEARGETREGRIAVAHVIKNRTLKSPAYYWSSSPAAVCHQRWQFSCWNSNDPNVVRLKQLTTKDHIYKECLEIAADVIAGKIPDPTKGSDHYHATYIKTPDWAESKFYTVTIGNHRFYNIVN